MYSRLRMPREIKIGRCYTVRGRVQGVGFRYFVEHAAQELGLDGYVKNRADGSVEVCARGSVEQLAELRQRLWAGPGLSRVEEVEEHESEVDLRQGFRVEH